MEQTKLKIDYKLLAVVKSVMEKISSKHIAEISKRFSDENDIECRILCCNNDMEELLLCLTSFYAFSKHYLEIYIHEDGTFDEECCALISELFPFVKLVTLNDADLEVSKKLNNSELLATRSRLLTTFKFHLRLIDFPLLSSRSRILSIDSDCFFFSNPDDLFEHIKRGERYIHGQGRFFSHGNAENILRAIGYINHLDLTQLPKPGAHLIVFPRKYFVDNLSLTQRFVNHLSTNGVKWCDEQGFLDIVLKNDFQEIALPFSSYVGTFWDNEISLDEYDFASNKTIKVIHCASNKEFLDSTKRKLLGLLEFKAINDTL